MSIDATHPRGGIALITLLVIAIFGVGIMITLSVVAVGESKMAGAASASEQTFYAAESGINEALIRLIEHPVPTPFSFTLQNTDINVNVAPNPANPYQRIITSTAEDGSGKIRTVRIIANTSSYAGGFDFAVQAGSGGIFMDPNSYIVGKVYSNADIIGGNNARVYSDTIAGINVPAEIRIAGPHTLENVDILRENSLGNILNDPTAGNAYSHSIKNSVMGQNAYYQNVIGQVKANNGADSCTEGENGPHCFDNSANLPTRPLPITDADIQLWKDQITASGNPELSPNPGDCPIAFAENTYCVNNSDVILGTQKINGDLFLGNGRTLTLTGNVWVTGDIIMNNNGIIRIHPDMGAASVVFLADETIDISNNYSVFGSGEPSSFLLMLSAKTRAALPAPCGDPALVPEIYASNNSSAIVFSSPHGILKVKNNGFLNAAAVEQLCLENNAGVTFNPHLVSFTIPAGGGQTIGTALGTWEEQ